MVAIKLNQVLDARTQYLLLSTRESLQYADDLPPSMTTVTIYGYISWIIGGRWIVVARFPCQDSLKVRYVCNLPVNEETDCRCWKTAKVTSMGASGPW